VGDGLSGFAENVVFPSLELATEILEMAVVHEVFVL
jgi:hypothetical protein